MVESNVIQICYILPISLEYGVLTGSKSNKMYEIMKLTMPYKTNCFQSSIKYRECFVKLLKTCASSHHILSQL